MWKKAELRIPKKLRRDGGVWLPRRKREMEMVGQAAMDMIRTRILTKQIDGDGRRLPKLEENKGWFFTARNDTRFPGLLKRSTWSGKEVSKQITRGNIVMAYPDGYAALKQRVTGKRRKRKDGYLTGDMWEKGFSQILKKVSGGWAIQLHFIGGTRVGKIKGWGNQTVFGKDPKTGKLGNYKMKVPKMKTVTLRNRDKAQGICERGETPVCSLLSLTAEETTQVMELYSSLITPFGETQAGGSLKGFSTKLFRKGRTLSP